MNKKLWPTVLACISIAPLFLALQGCGDTLSLEMQADDSPQVLSRVWEIDVPESMTTEEFYGSDVGFTGDGDFIRVMKLPKADQVGTWSLDGFQEPLDRVRAPIVIAESGAPLKVEDLNDLRCHPTTKREDGDYLILCYSTALDRYYSFESIS